MLTVAFSRTDLQLPAMAAVIPKIWSLSQVVPVLPTYKVNKSPSCRSVPAPCCGLGSADKQKGALDFQGWWLTLPPVGISPGSGFTTSVLLLAVEAAVREEKEAQQLPVPPKLCDLPWTEGSPILQTKPKMVLRDFPRTAEWHQANSASLLPQQCSNITS